MMSSFKCLVAFYILFFVTYYSNGYLIRPSSKSKSYTKCSFSSHRKRSPFIQSNKINQIKLQIKRSTSLKSSAEGNNILSSFKKSLEESWDSSKMGILPTTPKNAAKAAATSLKEAQSVLQGIKNVFFIDILLPSYEITDAKMYDEIMVVEFCIQLSKYLQDREDKSKKSIILVRDGNTLDLIQNVLDIRRSTNNNGDEENEESSSKKEVDSFRQQMLSGWDDEEEDTNNDDIKSSTTQSTSISTENEDIEKENKSTSNEDSFRQQLLSSWDDDDGTETDTKETSEPMETFISEDSTNDKDNVKNDNDSHYDINSLFGNEQISAGPDMFDDVLTTLTKLQPISDHHDTIILISPYTTEELIAIRRIIALYPDKTIILFNCKLDRQNYPREFLYSEMAYSILPLVIKKERNNNLDNSLFGSSDNNNGSNNEDSSKILVMRRYPNDWEIYIDTASNDSRSSGFQLVQSFDSETMISKHGPTMDVIASCVKRFMQSNTMTK